ncbi:MAG: tRNA lysidine(34) synthetase TilS [Hydrogenophilales bacterium 28-61-23]|nr:MAG: tRNA lysidine(34) synthetase TilS [Hydrogenophilales bacterium 28-61-23]
MTEARDPAADPLAALVAASLERHIQPASHLTVGYSGGLDSSVLLRLLAGLRDSARFSPNFTLAAVHVHHGLSPQADAWAQHCAQVCLDLNVPLAIHRVEVRLDGNGLEAAARAARYRVYAELDTDFLVLAHHRDDQAETVLLQLMRGAGLKGLAAMPELRRLVDHVALLRPLLAASRAEIAVWAERSAIGWIEDESNADVRLARNALRHEVMPPLAARFPAAAQVLSQAATRFAETASLLDALADLDGAVVSADGLALSALRALPEARARNVLRRFLARSGVEIHQESLREALRQLLGARQDAQVRVDFGASSLRLHRQRVVLAHDRQSPAVPVAEKVPWHGETCLELGGAGRLSGCLSGCLYFQAMTGAGIRLSPGDVSIRHRLGGERLRPEPGRPRRTLKNLLREAAIPAWQRQALPLVYVDETLVWAAGVGADRDFLVKPDETGWLISWRAALNKAV